MAVVEKVNRELAQRLDEIEKRIFQLKLNYEKYFGGRERLEPMKERDDLKRLIRDTGTVPMTASVQRFRFQGLKARFQSLELYWARNLLQIERGTHPKMKFQADLHAQRRAQPPPSGDRPSAPDPPSLAPDALQIIDPEEDEEEEAADPERAYRAVYSEYAAARAKAGLGATPGYAAVRDALRKQEAALRAAEGCETVNFRVAVEDGKVKLKAMPRSTRGS